MFQLLNYIAMFIAMISTFKMIFLTEKKIKNDFVMKNITTQLQNKKIQNHVCFYNNSHYYYDVDMDNTQKHSINPNVYIFM